MCRGKKKSSPSATGTPHTGSRPANRGGFARRCYSSSVVLRVCAAQLPAMDALFGLTGPDFVVVCADKMHARSIVKMDVRSRRPPPLPSPCCALASRNARPLTASRMGAAQHGQAARAEGGGQGHEDLRRGGRDRRRAPVLRLRGEEHLPLQPGAPHRRPLASNASRSMASRARRKMGSG